MSEQGLCERCGAPIPPRTDPRGRRARYCSDACRAAASRERREQRHRDEVTQAREQLVLETRHPDDSLLEAAAVLRSIARDVRRGEEVFATPAVRQLVDAGHELDAAWSRERQDDLPPVASLSRQQRRAMQRKKRRK